MTFIAANTYLTPLSVTLASEEGARESLREVSFRVFLSKERRGGKCKHTE